METFRDSQQAFRDAIRQGELEDTDNNNGKYAGDYMYMHSIKNTDYFKNINTRKYIEITNSKPMTKANRIYTDFLQREN